MSTWSANAEYCGHTKQLTSSSWDSDGAQEGQYTGNSGSRFGLIRFPSSLSDVDWTIQKVSSITLKFTFGSSGKSGTKVGKFWRSLSNSASGTASSHKGDALCNITFAHGYSSGGAETFTYTSGTVFDALVSYLETMHSSGIRSIGLYSGNTATSSSYSADYMKITAVWMSITYEAKGLTATVPDSMTMTTTSNITITNPSSTELTGSYTWKNGDSTITEYNDFTLAAGGSLMVKLLPWTYRTAIDFGGTAESIDTTFTVTTSTYSASQSYTIPLKGVTASVPTITGSRQTYDSETETYTDSVDGTYYRYTVKTTVSSMYRFVPTCTLTITDADGTAVYTATLCQGSGSASGGTYTYTDTASGISDIDATKDYTVTITNTNQWGGSATTVATIDKAWAAMHITKDGYGIGFGMFSTGTEASPRVDVGYPMYADNIVTHTQWTDTEFSLSQGRSAWAGTSDFPLQSGWVSYSGQQPAIFRIGAFVWLSGAVSLSSSKTINATPVNILKLPSWAIPYRPVQALQNGSGVAHWLMRVTTGGYITAERYIENNKTAYASVDAGAWFPLNACWIASDAITQ